MEKKKKEPARTRSDGGIHQAVHIESAKTPKVKVARVSEEQKEGLQGGHHE